MLSYLKNEESAQSAEEESTPEQGIRASTRERMLNMLTAGKLDEREVEIDVQENSRPITAFGNGEISGVGINLSEMLGGMMPKKTAKRRMKVRDALRVLQSDEAEKLVDMAAATRVALEKAQQEGIVSAEEAGHNVDVHHLMIWGASFSQ